MPSPRGAVHSAQPKRSSEVYSTVIRFICIKSVSPRTESRVAPVSHNHALDEQRRRILLLGFRSLLPSVPPTLNIWNSCGQCPGFFVLLEGPEAVKPMRDLEEDNCYPAAAEMIASSETIDSWALGHFGPWLYCSAHCYYCLSRESFSLSQCQWPSLTTRVSITFLDPFRLTFDSASLSTVYWVCPRVC